MSVGTPSWINRWQRNVRAMSKSGLARWPRTAARLPEAEGDDAASRCADNQVEMVDDRSIELFLDVSQECRRKNTFDATPINT
jgi:hypothetical protein